MKRTKLQDGRAFQDAITTTCTQYARAGLLRCKKVDPPMRIMGNGPARRIIFQENPFPDFIGAWTERGGRMVAFECKSTRDNRLAIGGSGGVTETQLANLMHWHHAGAAVFVLWEWRGAGVRMLSVEEIRVIQLSISRKSIPWDHWGVVKQGKGFVLHDFLENMRSTWK